MVIRSVELFSVKICRIERREVAMLHYDNRFVIPLYLRYALQYCNTKKFVIHLHEVTERMYLRGDKI